MKSRPAILRLVGRLAICAILLGWIFHAILLEEGRAAWLREGHAWTGLTRADQWRIAWTQGPAGLWRTMSLISPGAFAVSLIFMGGTIFLGVLRWRLVLGIQGMPLSLGRATEISLVAHFFNSFLLGSTGGDLMKAYYAAREQHHQKAEAVTTVLVDRLMGLFSMLLFACVMMLFNLPLLAAHRRLAALAGVILLMLLACTILLLLSFWGGLSKRWAQPRRWLQRLPKADTLERALESCRRYGREPGFLWRSLALSMTINAVCVLQVFSLSAGLGLDVPLLALFVIVPVVVCISALPITPSGLGVRENLYVLMLAVPEIHVGAAQALALSLLAYGGSLIWSVLGGLVYVGLRERHHLAEITRPGGPAEDAPAG